MLKNPGAIKRALSSGGADKDLEEIASRNGIKIEAARQKEVKRIAGENSVNQGIIALVDTSSLIVDLDSFLRSTDINTDTLLVLLDELTDPHNVGAVIRSAAAFGASGVLLPSHNQAPVTGTVVKASAGMVFAIPVVSIRNVNQTVDSLKKIGFKTYALAMDGGVSLKDEKFGEPTVIVIGGEEKGVRQKTMERCDTVLRIPINPACESLNASVAAGVFLYEWSSKQK